MKYIVIVFIIFSQLAGCQPASQQEVFLPYPEGFYIQDSLLFYKGKKINLSLDVKSLTKVLGSYNRIIENQWGGTNVKNWYWKKGKHYAYLYSKDSLINFSNGIKGKSEKYKTIEEIEKKYGKFDSLYIHYNNQKEINRYYIWDSLGIQAVSVNDSLREINFFTDQDRLIKRETDPSHIYMDKLTINGITLDLAERKWDTWTKGINALGISSKDYAPPGDSKDWTRYLRTPYFVFTFSRSNNVLSQPFNPNNVKKIPDFFDEVEIGINTVAFDRLKRKNK